MTISDPLLPKENHPSVSITPTDTLMPVSFAPKKGIRTQLGRLAIKFHVIKEARKQEAPLLFNPHPEGLEPLLPPSHYKELDGLAITERKLVTDTDHEVTLWEHKAKPGRPHIFYFQGRSGHVADTGKAANPEEGYDRKVGLKFLSEVAKTGAGFTCVTLSGYGNNKGVPGEKAFKKDIKAIVRDWLQQKDHLPSDQVIVAGYSLGGANAAIMTHELTKKGQPPALLVIANSFSSMITRGTEFLTEKLSNHEDERVRDVRLSESNVDWLISRNKFNTINLFKSFSPRTHIAFAYSSDDKLVSKTHSERMIEAAKLHIPVMEKCFEGYGHTNVPAAMLAQYIDTAYDYVKSPQGQREKQAMQQRVKTPINFARLAERETLNGNSHGAER